MNIQTSDAIVASLKGAFMSLLLIISFFLPRIWENNTTVSSINSLLIVVILLTAVSVVKATAALFEKSRLKTVTFIALSLLPVFNIAVACVQFVFAEEVSPTAEWFTALLVIFSLPVFCCLYFTVMCVFCKKDKRLLILTVLLDVTGISYVIIRLADKVIIDAGAGDMLSVVSPWFSFIIYSASLISFIICIKIFSATNENQRNI